MGSKTRLSWKFSGQCYMVFCLFFESPLLNCALCDMVRKISSPAQVSRQSCPVKVDGVTSSRKDLDLHERLQAIQGQMG